MKLQANAERVGGEAAQLENPGPTEPAAEVAPIAEAAAEVPIAEPAPELAPVPVPLELALGLAPLLVPSWVQRGRLRSLVGTFLAHEPAERRTAQS